MGPDKAKTYGNFLDNINFEIYHPLSGSTTTHGSAVVGESGGTTGGAGGTEGHKVTVDNKLATYVPDGEPLIIQAIIQADDAVNGCKFVGVYYTRLDEDGNPVTEFIQLAGSEIEDSGDLTDEQKKGNWVKSENADGDIIYTYILDNMTSATDLHFIFIKNPTVTYDPNGGKDYIVERIYNTDEEQNVYSFKPASGISDTDTTFVPPYVSYAAEGQNIDWKFTGWKLTGDIVDYSGDNKVNADRLGEMILPAEHTIACDYSLDGASGERAAQYFKIYSGNVSLTEEIIKTDGQVKGVLWQDNSEEKLYANVHRGLTMVAQWRWRQAIIPQSGQNGVYTDSAKGGTVEFISVTDTSDENYNSSYNENGGKSYFAKTDEKVVIKATEKAGWKFIGWYDANGNLVSINAEFSYSETKEGINTYYARFSNSVTQTYIRQLKNGDSWDNITDDKIATLGRYEYTDAIGMPISSTVTSVGAGYKFVGWYDSNGYKVNDDMLINNGMTISYTTTKDATYYARFETLYTLNVKKVDGNNKTLANAEFSLYRKATAEELADSSIAKKTLSYKSTSIKCVLIESKATPSSGTASFSNKLTAGNEYYLYETKAPGGYKPLFEPIKITLNSTGTAANVDGTGYTITNRAFSIQIANDLLPDMHFTKTADKTSVTKGDKVAYTIAVDIPAYPDEAIDKSFYVSDLLPDGLTIDTSSIKVLRNGADITKQAGTQYVLDDAANKTTQPYYTFKLSVSTQQYADNWSTDGGKQLVITYTATLNNNASVNSKQTNTATFDYSIDPSYAGRHIQTTASADVTTFGIKINKYDSGNKNTKLANAKFDLYRTATQAEIDANKAVKIPHTEIQGIKLEAGKATDNDGVAVFEKYEANADKYDYYLVEVAAPSGYNLLVEAVKVNFADNKVDGNGYYTVDIANNSMIEMPITGGFSTVSFYVIGIALMLSALTAYVIFLKIVKAKENR